MKKYIIIILFLAVSLNGFSQNTLHVEGQITNLANGIGIPNYTIYITDSVSYYDSISTGANGYYTLLITNTTPNTIYSIFTRDCNNTLHFGTANTNNALTTIDFSICVNIVMNCQNGFTYTKQNTTFNFSGTNISTYPTEYYWNFGDGNTGIGQNVTHIFPQPTAGVSNYQVTLYTKSIYPNDTCFSQSIQTVMVIDTIPIIRGKVTANDTAVSNGWITLFGINNPVGSCVAIDSSFIDNQGNYLFSDFTINYPAYILKAEFPISSVIGNDYIPTYYDTLYSWMNSPPVFPVTNGSVYDIQLLQYVQNQPLGVGSVSGNIFTDGSKSTLSVLQDVDIMLINQNNKVLKFQKLSSQGSYSFANLPFANYKVFVELPGKITIPANITLNSSIPDITMLNFKITDNVITLAINNELELANAISDIYPNPANQEAYIDFSLKKTENIEIAIYNQYGQKMLTEILLIETRNQRITLAINELKAGFYTVKISNKSQTLSRKLIKF